jgi:hypothetical protein
MLGSWHSDILILDTGGQLSSCGCWCQNSNHEQLSVSVENRDIEEDGYEPLLL